MELERRQILKGGIMLCSTVFPFTALNKTDIVVSKESKKKESKKKGEEVTATEDLMREHGVLRRALLVYSETVPQLSAKAPSIAPEMLQRTAKLFRDFGEDYHERKLEEAYIFPALKKQGSPASGLADILIKQHQRGREITDYILSVTQGGKLDPQNEAPLAQSLQSFVLMYQNHTAREDTIIFPAWKKTLSAKEYDGLGEKFESIEHQQFGEDGFEKAVREIEEIERALGFSDLSKFTAPAPPGK